MDDALPPRCGMAPAFSGDRAGPAADEQNEVGLVEYCAGFVRAAVRSDHAESQRMAVEDRALAAARGRDDGPQPPGQRRYPAPRSGGETWKGDRWGQRVVGSVST